MQKYLFVFLFLFISRAFSQNFDSLLLYAVKVSTDTAKVNLFYSEGFEKRNRHPQYAYNCARQAEFFGQQAKSNKHLAKAYNLLGILFYKKGDLKTALDYHQKALSLREIENDEYGITLSEINIGNILSDLQKYELAELSYARALQINSKLGTLKQCGNCYINLGVLKMSQAQPDEAEKNFYEAFKIAKSIVDYELEALALNNLSYISILKGNYEVAVSKCFDALKAKDIMDNEVEKTDSYLNLAKAFFYLKDFKNMNFYLAKADSFWRAYNYTEAQFEYYRLVSEIYEYNKNHEAALTAFKRFTELKDSLLTEKQLLAASYNFTDYDSKELSAKEKQSFRFPYLMLFVLVFGSGFLFYVVMRNKK